MIILPRHSLDIPTTRLMITALGKNENLKRDAIERAISELWDGKKHSIACFSVRTAFDAILRSLDIGSGDEIIMSAITINDMVEIAKMNGLKVVPADIQKDTLLPSVIEIEKYITGKTRAIVIAQLFGTIDELEAIGQICRKYAIPLIEDCAQAYCGKKYQGSKWADVSLFSFGPLKTMACLGGAIATSDNKEILDVIQSIHARYKLKSDLWVRKRALKYSAIKLLMHQWVFWVVLTILKLLRKNYDIFINSFGRSFKGTSILENIRYQTPTRLLALIKTRLANDDQKTYDQRSALRAKLEKALASDALVGHKAKWNTFWVTPIMVNNPIKVIKRLFKQGIDATTGRQSQIYIECPEIGLGSNGTAKQIIENSIYLPNLSLLREKHVQTIKEEIMISKM